MFNTNNPENSLTTKVSEYIPSGFSMSTMSEFKTIENRHDVYRGRDSMKVLWILKRARNGKKKEKRKKLSY